MFRLKMVFSFLKGTKPSELLAKLVRGIAEGQFGETAKKVYWALEGKKSWIALVIASATFALEKAYMAGVCESCLGISTTLYTVAGFLLAVGLYDGAVRSTPPTKEK